MSIGLSIGLVPNWWQAIIWTNADPVHWRIFASLGRNELRWVSDRLCMLWWPLGLCWYILTLWHIYWASQCDNGHTFAFVLSEGVIPMFSFKYHEGCTIDIMLLFTVVDCRVWHGPNMTIMHTTGWHQLGNIGPTLYTNKTSHTGLGWKILVPRRRLRRHPITFTLKQIFWYLLWVRRNFITRSVLPIEAEWHIYASVN